MLIMASRLLILLLSLTIFAFSVLSSFSCLLVFTLRRSTANQISLDGFIALLGQDFYSIFSLAFWVPFLLLQIVSHSEFRPLWFPLLLFGLFLFLIVYLLQVQTQELLLFSYWLGLWKFTPFLLQKQEECSHSMKPVQKQSNEVRHLKEKQLRVAYYQRQEFIQV